MKKRFLAILLSVIILISILPVSAMAVKVIASGNCGDNLTWKLDSDGELTVSGEGPMEDLFTEAPNASDGAWGKYRADIKSVIIEEGVTSISDNSFRNCENITEIRIPASVLDIGDYAFEGCKSLLRFIVSRDNGYYCNDKQGLLYTKDMILLKCAPYAADTMVLPEEVLEIANDAFSDGDFENTIRCTGDAITYYGITMFDNVIYYPEDNPTWTEAIKGAFGSNMWFTYIPGEIIVETSGKCGENLTWNLNEEGVLTISGEGETWACWEYDPSWSEMGVIEVIIEEGVTGIGEFTFWNCYYIETITIPKTVKEINDSAFTNTWVSRIVFEGDAPIIDERAFAGSVANIYYPEDNPTWTAEVMQSCGGNGIVWFPYSNYIKGDVNGDGLLSNTDVVMIARYLVELYDEDTIEAIEAHCDMDGDGKISNIDLIKIVRIIVGLV